MFSTAQPLDRDVIADAKSVYLIGIGGVGMSGLARVLKHYGLEVSGSDRKENHTTRELAREGIRVFIGQTAVHFECPDLIVYSSAVCEDHLELAAARRSRARVLHRAEVLSSLLNRATTSIAVTGTHGKTTTSSMISFVLSELGKQPTCLVGSDMVNRGSNVILGDCGLVVAEVDESDKSHRLYAPNYTVVTNLEEDHMDHYRDLQDLESTFEEFLSHARNPGLVAYSGEDPVLRRLMTRVQKPKVSFGFSPVCDFSARDIRISGGTCEFDLLENGFFSHTFKLVVPGIHNIANALAAIAVLTQMGIDSEQIREPLARFRGTRRRLEIKWESPDLVIVDDYAHHPTEVSASLRALKQLQKPLTVIFQPHRFSRTRYFHKQFGNAFRDADELILTDVYSAGEIDSEGAGVQLIYDEVLKNGHPDVSVVSKEKILNDLLGRSGLHGVVAFLGAGDIGEIADEFASRFKSFVTA